MDHVENILPVVNGDIGANHVGENNKKGFDFRISKIANVISKYMVPTSILITTFTIVPAVALGTAAAINVMIVSSVVLGVVAGVRLYQISYDHLPEKVKRVADYIETFITDLFAKVVLGFSFPASLFMKEPYDHESKGKQEPILLIHGYLSHRSHWWYIRRRLKAAGQHQVYTVNLGSPFHSIEEYAKVVENKVKEIQDKTGYKTVKLVGHSMGGLVASHYAATLAPNNAENISQIISLGSPLKGTKPAVIPATLGLGTCAKQMRYKSPFIKKLKESITALKAKSNVKFHHVGSSCDTIIRPANSALLSKKLDPADTKMLHGLGHVGYLFSDRIADHLIEKL